VADSLQVGEVSEPFKTQFGWHIVQVMERREHDNTAEVLRAAARQQIRERKLEEEGQAWLAQIRDTAFVEYRLEEE
jgi:peptidyl-prolyl cis-trans isomerase SurA